MVAQIATTASRSFFERYKFPPNWRILYNAWDLGSVSDPLSYQILVNSDKDKETAGNPQRRRGEKNEKLSKKKAKSRSTDTTHDRGKIYSLRYDKTQTRDSYVFPSLVLALVEVLRTHVSLDAHLMMMSVVLRNQGKRSLTKFFDMENYSGTPAAVIMRWKQFLNFCDFYEDLPPSSRQLYEEAYLLRYCLNTAFLLPKVVPVSEKRLLENAKYNLESLAKRKEKESLIVELAVHLDIFFFALEQLFFSQQRTGLMNFFLNFSSTFANSMDCVPGMSVEFFSEKDWDFLAQFNDV